MRADRSPGGRRHFHTPWWVSVLLAILCYCALKYLAPQLQPASPGLAKLVEAAPSFAPIVAIPLLLLAAKQLYDTAEPSDQNGDNDDRENDRTD